MNQAGVLVMRVFAPAKINLTLEVLNKRDDGYHALRSVMIPLAFGDVLHIVADAQTSLSCTDPTLENRDNIVLRALEAIDVRARLALEKRLPVCAGLGGGSSDAAATIRAVIDGACGPVAPRDWNGLARAIGSDVPFFLCGTGALVEGTGERVTPLGALPGWGVIIVKPPIAVSTAEAYRELDGTNRPVRSRSASVSLDMVEAVQRAQFARVQELMHNDFHRHALGAHPAIAFACERLRDAGGNEALLCGSGSAVFALFEDAAAAADTATRVRLDERFAVIATQFARAPDWRAEAR